MRKPRQPTRLVISTTCHKVNGAGKIVDKSDSCVITIDGNEVTIVESGGVGTVITINVTATDTLGNVSEAAFVVNVLNPGKGKGKGKK